jgi:hypothetical protein
MKNTGEYWVESKHTKVLKKKVIAKKVIAVVASRRDFSISKNGWKILSANERG